MIWKIVEGVLAFIGAIVVIWVAFFVVNLLKSKGNPFK